MTRTIAFANTHHRLLYAFQKPIFLSEEQKKRAQSVARPRSSLIVRQRNPPLNIGWERRGGYYGGAPSVAGNGDITFQWGEGWCHVRRQENRQKKTQDINARKWKAIIPGAFYKNLINLIICCRIPHHHPPIQLSKGAFSTSLECWVRKDWGPPPSLKVGNEVFPYIGNYTRQKQVKNLKQGGLRTTYAQYVFLDCPTNYETIVCARQNVSIGVLFHMVCSWGGLPRNGFDPIHQPNELFLENNHQFSAYTPTLGLYVQLTWPEVIHYSTKATVQNTL